MLSQVTSAADDDKKANHGVVVLGSMNAKVSIFAYVDRASGISRLLVIYRGVKK
jgi:hypothetical protein